MTIRIEKQWLVQFLGILPFLLVLPFLYFPKIHPGDTQPWILLLGVLTYVLWRTRCVVSLNGILLGFLSLILLVIVLGDPREGILVREAFILVSLLVFWELAIRDRGRFLHLGLKWVLVLFLLVALLQTASVTLGFSFPISGRFVAGRGGVPSLACEPAMLGTIGSIITMYLLDRGDSLYWALPGVFLVVLSGSLSGILFIVFPMLHRRMRKVALWVFPFVLTLVCLSIFSSGFKLTSRLDHLIERGISPTSLLADHSTNYRAGHVVYSIKNAWQTLNFEEERPFSKAYNDSADRSETYIPTGDDGILTFGGEMFYYFGWFGFVLLAFVYLSGIGRANAGPLHYCFVTCLFLNPVSFAVPYFVFYLVGIRKTWRTSEPDPIDGGYSRAC